MQQKLKSVFRRSSKSKGSSGARERQGTNSQYSNANPPRADRQRASSDRHGRTSIDSSATGSVYTGRSRPVSSVYDDHHQSQASVGHAAASKVASPDDPNGGAIAKDYKAYLPALSPVNDEHGDEYVTLNGDRGHITEGSEVRHEEEVADRNIARYGASIDGEHRNTAGVAHNGSAEASFTTPIPSIQSARVGSRKQGLVDVTPHIGAVDSRPGVHYATVDGAADGEETALARKLREDGVVDLRNTIDTDGDVTWAPAVTREVIKPHRHEIVQHKIYREVHNYEHFHRIQPVMMTEVLPPRHWIPNPSGEGLIEIAAEELPARTGDNRWWSICQHSSPYSRQAALPKYRTEPEIIEAGTFMTEHGFERKETIIIHPPTLADLTGYGGPVQAMHFDHKTGMSWMGELTTLDKLHELQKELDRAPDARPFEMNGLGTALPKLS